MMTISVICFVAGTWVPPLDWTITKIENRSASAAITLSKSAKDGDNILVPSGCATEEPHGYSWGSYAIPLGGFGTITPNTTLEYNAEKNSMGEGTIVPAVPNMK